ncbi:MAG: Signal peptidase I [Candidatus Anoxychlamydiales bacterium]|nr:Signal peptidase I [Candidatus Anoxychlamydiales bacterium]NGX35651.1 Signal peptidase I [Candidatus Anoxychlamydiales bacterium]
MFKKSTYSLYRCRKVLRHVYTRYNRKKKTLSDIQKKRFENVLTSLQTSIVQKNKKAADRAAKNLEKLTTLYLKKSSFDHIIDVFFALLFAVVVAVIVRQMWFEFLTIPTGSMRPTLKEKDMVIVSKTNFGINIPLRLKHFYFDQNLLKRGSIVVFSSANLDMPDSSMLYFYLFPGKKQLVKRLIGKPGDTLYFYGGKIYGIDQHGDEIDEFNTKWFEDIEHIPFIKFEGKVATPSRFSEDLYSPVIFYQMNEPIAMLNVTSMGQVDGELITEHSSVFTKNSEIKNYFNIWGFNNYAMGRILSKNEVEKYSNDTLLDIEEAPLYLELTHHPTLKGAKIIRDELGRLRPALNYSTSLFPLEEASLKEIFKSMYTARFCVKNEYAYRYGSSIKNTKYLPKLLGVKDGCYEIQNGKAYSVDWFGIVKILKEDHSLNQFSYERTKILYNLGIDFLTFLEPYRKNQLQIPSRYAYFRNKDFYLMGHRIFKQSNATLVNFIQREYKKQSTIHLYKAFEDLGPPLDLNGKLNKETIAKYGIKIPDKMYLFLGDNYAGSSDSRDFGFVPEDNLKGGLNFIFWPPSKRWGGAFQPPFKIFIFPKIIIWSSAFVIIAIYLIFIRRRIKKPLKF